MVEPAKSAHSPSQYMAYIDCQIREVLSQGLPPFVVLDEYNLRRELPSS